MDSEEGMFVMKRAEIDTSAPFRSVKEAVMLFGERVLAGEVYANKLKEIREKDHGPSKLGTVTSELEETKQSLQKAREEGILMANCLTSLQQELEQTKKELQKLKVRDYDHQFEKQKIESEEIKDIKFIEKATSTEVDYARKVNEYEEDKEDGLILEFQKKRYVKFASPPSLAQVMSPEEEGNNEVLKRHPSLKKKKKKPLIPLIGGIFSKKKVNQQVPLPKTRAL
ncbi:hypothetical protein BVC80_8873g13 [Macleaya cordata]|uniref:WEB family n=1 Tax=Macleaya cordata TaxID=56857 RepID=A0A200Q372_MACCD|nr:hypothetical protein BVC80_8873g13 [Macleaya cordata]